jgi:hypothetical protein
MHTIGSKMSPDEYTSRSSTWEMRMHPTLKLAHILQPASFWHL